MFDLHEDVKFGKKALAWGHIRLKSITQTSRCSKGFISFMAVNIECCD